MRFFKKACPMVGLLLSMFLLSGCDDDTSTDDVSVSTLPTVMVELLPVSAETEPAQTHASPVSADFIYSDSLIPEHDLIVPPEQQHIEQYLNARLSLQNGDIVEGIVTASNSISQEIAPDERQYSFHRVGMHDERYYYESLYQLANLPKFLTVKDISGQEHVLRVSVVPGTFVDDQVAMMESSILLESETEYSNDVEMLFAGQTGTITTPGEPHTYVIPYLPEGGYAVTAQGIDTQIQILAQGIDDSIRDNDNFDYRGEKVSFYHMSGSITINVYAFGDNTGDFDFFLMEEDDILAALLGRPAPVQTPELLQRRAAKQ